MTKILVLGNNDGGLYSFRKELINALLMEGYAVHLAVPSGPRVEWFQSIGCDYIETPIDRRGTNPVTDLKLLLLYNRIIKKVKPDIVLTYTIKPNIYGGLASQFNNVPYISNITGMGNAINSGGVKAKLVLSMLRAGLKKPRCVFFQNRMNMDYFHDKQIINTKAILIPGSGVNLTDHCLEDYPPEGITRFLFIGRIMREKGIEEYLAAARSIKERYPNTEFHIVGFCEESYEEKLEHLQKQKKVIYHGKQNNVHAFFTLSHAIILPSYHEGMSNVLLEAASSGRPVIASNIPGCRETFDEGISGYGIKVKNTNALIAAIERFLSLTNEEKKQMGLAGRAKVEQQFDRRIIVNAYLEEINKYLTEKR